MKTVKMTFVNTKLMLQREQRKHWLIKLLPNRLRKIIPRVMMKINHKKLKFAPISKRKNSVLVMNSSQLSHGRVK